MITAAPQNIALTIGTLDRSLSEFLLLVEIGNIDQADAQTLKHHADDLIGVGNRALEVLEKRQQETEANSPRAR